jgi:hypothetical protein
MREAQDSRPHSITLLMTVRKFVFIDDLVFRPTYGGLGLRHMLTTAAGAAAGTEFHSIRCHTRDIANKCLA